jgi:hypothetical protein
MGTITNFSKDHIICVLCDCNQEVLVLNYDEKTKTLDLAMYESYAAYKNNSSWFQKIRYIWKILTDRRLYTDQIVINHQQIKDISKFLCELITK